MRADYCHRARSIRSAALGAVDGARGRGLTGWTPWLFGLLTALVVLGPALRPGALLNLDLVITPEVPVPRGAWGLGPDLPRRVPLGLALAWASSLVGGPVAAKVLFGACLTGAFAGVWRLATGAPPLCRVGAGLLYTLSPYTLTRLGVGHWMLVASIAVLPWALPHLLRPNEARPRTFLWALALGITGVNGGLFAAILVTVGVIADRGRGAIRVATLVLIAQLPWLVPGAIVLGSAPPDLADPRYFATRSEGLLGLLRVIVGDGFWRELSQVGAVRGTGAALLGAGLLAMAVLGRRDLSSAWGGRAAVAAVLGLAVVLASAVPGAEALYRQLAGTQMGATLRDGQRMLALFLVWLAPAAAVGVTRLYEGARPSLVPVVHALPALAAAVLAAPALWGIGGALRPVSFPAGWAEAREVVASAPGTLVALPWHEYLDLDFADDRRVFNPVPDYFGHDVIFSSDPELGRRSSEQADPRELHVRRVAEQVRSARPQSEELARLGVRWVVLLHEVDWRRYSALSADPGLEAVIATPALELFRVKGWRGPFVDDLGHAVEGRSLLGPLATVEASGPLSWARPAIPGWVRGTSTAGRTETGLVRLPAGDGPVWYWPSLMTLAADMTTLGVAVVALRRCKNARDGKETEATGVGFRDSDHPGYEVADLDPPKAGV